MNHEIEDPNHDNGPRRWSFDDQTNYGEFEFSDEELKPYHAQYDEGDVEEVQAQHWEPIAPPSLHFFDDEPKNLPKLPIKTKKGMVNLTIFTQAEGDRVMTDLKKDYAPVVAANSMEASPNERVLVYKAGLGVMGFTLASVNENSNFLLYEPNILSASILDRNETANSNIMNASLITTDQLHTLTQEHPVDAVIFEAGRYSGLETLRSDIELMSQILIENGSLYLVTHKKAGADRHQQILSEIFNSDAICIYKGKGGYRVYRAEKGENPVDIMQRFIAIDFIVLGQQLEAVTQPGIFSKEGLDHGTRLLLETVFKQEATTKPNRILDVGCGWGAIGLVAAQENPEANIIMTDVDSRAVSLAKRNLEILGLSDRVEAIATADITEDVSGKFDLILSNPPFHADIPVLKDFFRGIRNKMLKQGKLFIVVEKTYATKFIDIMTETFGAVQIVNEGEQDNGSYYYILGFQK